MAQYLLRRTAAKLLLLLASLALAVLVMEGVARLAGYKPWRAPAVWQRVEPGGKRFQRHPRLGYTHLPGAYTVALANGYSFRVTHGDDALRITEPHPPDPDQRTPIWIFGGSFTYGWSLSDHETFPWLLQEAFPNFHVINFGVGGYGTIHALVQFEEALQTRPKPALAVIAYGSFHDERNTFARHRRKWVSLYNHLGPLVQPYARVDAEGTLRINMAEVVYRELPLMRRSALAHAAAQVYDNWENLAARSDVVTLALMERLRQLAEPEGVGLLVVGLDLPSKPFIPKLNERGIPAADISLDFQIRAHRNVPHDGHPSPLANRKYAERLERLIRQRLRPPVSDAGPEAVTRRPSRM